MTTLYDRICAWLFGKWEVKICSNVDLTCASPYNPDPKRPWQVIKENLDEGWEPFAMTAHSRPVEDGTYTYYDFALRRRVRR